MTVLGNLLRGSSCKGIQITSRGVDNVKATQSVVRCAFFAKNNGFCGKNTKKNILFGYYVSHGCDLITPGASASEFL